MGIFDAVNAEAEVGLPLVAADLALVMEWNLDDVTQNAVESLHADDDADSAPKPSRSAAAIWSAW